MQSVLLVGLGGFVGSVLRYGLGRIPVGGAYPITTMVINILGSFAIGFIFACAEDREAVGPQAVLFLQTGLCGGFTTFSTFALETVTFFQNHRRWTGLTYAACSVGLCLAGTFFGMLLAGAVKRKLAP